MDLGQNFAGVVRIHLRGPAGTTVGPVHSELLRPDGDEVELEITVPAGTTALVDLGNDPDVTLGGGIHVLRRPVPPTARAD